MKQPDLILTEIRANPSAEEVLRKAVAAWLSKELGQQAGTAPQQSLKK